MTDDNASLSSKDVSFSFEDYLDYQKKLREYNVQNRSILFFNESGIHAAIVINEIIKRAIEKKKNIEMFCGKFFLFRDDFKKVIEETRKELKSKIADGQQEEFNRFNPCMELKESLEAFFEAKLQMNVILEEEGSFEGIKKDSNWNDYYKNRMKEKLLHFYQIDPNLQVELDHFIVSGTSFRKENSKYYKTAMCSFNRPEYARMYHETFNLMKEVSVECSI